MEQSEGNFYLLLPSHVPTNLYYYSPFSYYYGWLVMIPLEGEPLHLCFGSKSLSLLEGHCPSNCIPSPISSSSFLSIGSFLSAYKRVMIFHWSLFLLQLLVHFFIPLCIYTCCHPPLFSSSLKPSLVRFFPHPSSEMAFVKATSDFPDCQIQWPILSPHRTWPVIPFSWTLFTWLLGHHSLGSLAPLLLISRPSLTSQLWSTFGLGPPMSSLFYLHSHPR